MKKARENFTEYVREDQAFDIPLGKLVSKKIQSGLISDEGDTQNVSVKVLHVLRHNLETSENAVASLMNTLTKIRDISAMKDTKEMIFLSSGDLDGRIRKMLEVVFTKEPYRVGLWLKDARRTRTRSPGNFQRADRSKVEVYTLNPAPGTSYEEVVRKMRRKVDPN